MRLKQKIESHFGIPLARVIADLHWTGRRSLNSLAAEAGVTRQGMAYCARAAGLKLRGISNAAGRGARRHWSLGLTKESDPRLARISERMKRTNPAKTPGVYAKIAASRASAFIRNPWPQEIEMRAILDSLGVEYVFQFPIDRYTIDFFLSEKRICLEVDSMANWGHARKAHADKRDIFLASLGFTTVRIDKRILRNRREVVNILKANDIIS